MSKVIMGNWDFTVPWLELKMFQRVEGDSTNPCIHTVSFLLARHREPPSSRAKLFLPMIPIVALSRTLLHLCWTTFLETTVYKGLKHNRNQRILWGVLLSKMQFLSIFKRPVSSLTLQGSSFAPSATPTQS